MARTLRVEIVGDSTALQAALARAAGSASAFGGSMGKAGASMVATGKMLNRHITLPILAIGAVATKLGMDFASSMELIHTQAGAPQKDIENLSKAVLGLAGPTATAPEELSKGLYHLESQGLRGTKAMNALRVAAEGAKVGQADLEDVTNALGAAITVGIKGTDNYTKTMGALNAIVGVGDMRMQDLADAFGTQLVAQAKVAGLSITQVGGALAIFGDANIRGAEAGTLLGSTIRLLGSGSKATDKQLKTIGLSTLTLAKDMRSGGLIKVLEDLKQHMEDAGMSADEASIFLSRAFGGRQSGGIKLLISEMDRLKGKTAEVAKGSQSFAQVWDDTTKTTAFKFQAMKTTVEASLIGIGGHLAPVVTAVAGEVRKLSTAFDGLSPHTQKLILIGLGIAAAMGPVISIIGRVVQAINILKVSLMSLAAGNPIALALTGIALAATAIGGHFLAASQHAHELASAFQAVKSAADPLGNSIQGVKQANLDLSVSQAGVTSTLHQAQSAQQTYMGYVRAGTQATLAGKQAHDTAIAAWNAHKQAVLDLTRAQGAQTTAQAAATGQMRTALQPVLAFGQAIQGSTSVAEAFGIKIQGTIPHLAQMIGGLVGTYHAGQVTAAGARQWGIGVETAGRQMYAAAVNAEHMTPAGRAAHEAMGLMTQAAGRVARETGKVPTSIQQVVAAAKKSPESGRIFEGAMRAMVTSAQKVGVNVPRWMRQAATHSKTAADQLASGVKKPLSTLPAAGSAAGHGTGANLASGLRGQIGPVRAAAQALAAAAKVPLSTKFGSTPEQWGDARARELVRGWVLGTLSGAGAATTSAQRVANATKAGLTSSQIMTAVKQYGTTLGREHALAIVRGVIGVQPTLAQQVKIALAQAATQAKADAAQKYADLAQAALAAFDAKVAAWKNPIAAKLSGMQMADQIKNVRTTLASAIAQVEGGGDLLQAFNIQQQIEHLTGAQLTAAVNTAKAQAAQAIQTAEGAYTTAQAQLTAANAALTAAQSTGDQDAIDKATQAQQTASTAFETAKTNLQTAITNQQTLDDAVRGKLEQDTGTLAAAEDRRHATIAAHQRTGLVKRLAELRTQLLEDPKEWDKMGIAVQKVAASYLGKMEASGKGWATRFAAGIRSGIPAVTSAVAAMTGVVADHMPQSPAKTGPLSYDAAISGRAWAERFGEGFSGSFSRVAATAMTGPAGGRFASSGGGGGGGPEVHVHVHGALMGSSASEVAEIVRNELYDKRRRNGSLGF